jgi:hypothetical protein
LGGGLNNSVVRFLLYTKVKVVVHNIDTRAGERDFNTHQYQKWGPCRINKAQKGK